MGVYLVWKPAVGSSYTNTYIYRANSESGTYSEIANQTYDDLNYYDVSGSTSNWYKVRFYDSLAISWSDYSDAIQGGVVSCYCSIQDVRDITNLTTTDISDANLCILINLSATQVNREVSVYVEEEDIRYIDGMRKNAVDASNTIYWTYNYPIADSNDNFKVTTSDITVYEYDTSTDPTTRTELTVSSITPNTGRFVLSAAPTADKTLTVTYRWAPESLSTPHPLIKMATMLLTAAWAYQKINVGKAPRFKLGNVQLSRDMDSFKVYYARYKEILSEIIERYLTDTRTSPSLPTLNDYEFQPTIPDRDLKR